jgi:hypothetical protein
MGFLVSPGVQVREIDLTNVVPAVSTSIGAIAGPFERGPVSTVTAISSEQELVQVFGKPNGSNFEFWFTASSFLQYGDALRVVRAESAIVNAVATGSAVLIRDTDHYLNAYSTGQATVGEWAARTAGTWANGIGVSICATATAFEENLGSSNQTAGEDAVGSTTILLMTSLPLVLVILSPSQVQMHLQTQHYSHLTLVTKETSTKLLQFLQMTSQFV